MKFKNKRGGLSLWGTIGALVLLGILLLSSTSLVAKTTKGGTTVIDNYVCGTDDFDGDGMSNWAESGELTTVDRPCPCDKSTDREGWVYVLRNSTFNKSSKTEGVYEIFDHEKKDELLAQGWITDADLTQLLDKLRKLSEDNDIMVQSMPMVLSSNLQQFIKKDANLVNPSPTFFCPLSCSSKYALGKDSTGYKKYACCPPEEFLKEWFASGYGVDGLIGHCRTPENKCKQKIALACKDDRQKKDKSGYQTSK